MTTFSAPDVSAISPPKLSPFPVPDAKDVCVDDDGAIDQSRMLASPKLSIPHSVKTHEPEGSRLLLTHLRGRTAQQQQQLALGGRMIQAEQNERWAEMSAWCGFLATNLEGACCRIEQLGAEIFTTGAGMGVPRHGAAARWRDGGAKVGDPRRGCAMQPSGPRIRRLNLWECSRQFGTLRHTGTHREVL